MRRNRPENAALRRASDGMGAAVARFARACGNSPQVETGAQGDWRSKMDSNLRYGFPPANPRNVATLSDQHPCRDKMARIRKIPRNSRSQGIPVRFVNWGNIFSLFEKKWRKIRHLRGGAGGIRTHDRLLTYTHFPGVRLRPLGHRSACLTAQEPQAGRAGSDGGAG